ncbi:MAG: putative mitochondrial protein, conserved [Chrysothrix sp. TS-e1954]|nr:MAG: putative mitochondrial protein, conserved [Chrysothrix sp. TS-e1954]
MSRILARVSVGRQPSRTLVSTATRRTAWSPGPAPPRLPKDEQEIYEQLQKQSTGAFSTPRKPPQINQSPQSAPQTVDSLNDTTSATVKSTSTDQDLRAKVEDGDELHPHIRRGAKPEFEGDVNPKTGEVSGPKNEPLRWGGQVDWSYNGRVTDF